MARLELPLALAEVGARQGLERSELLILSQDDGVKIDSESEFQGGVWRQRAEIDSFRGRQPPGGGAGAILTSQCQLPSSVMGC